MLRLRNIAFGLLPLLVVLWAAVAVLGGALYLANHADSPDDVAKAGLGLCTVSVAIFAGRGIRRVVTPLFAIGARRGPIVPVAPARPVCGVFRGPPATGPPIFRLLRVSRT